MPSIIHHREVLAAILLGLSISSWAAPIYKHVDENGNVSYSDSSQSANDEIIKLEPINTQTSQHEETFQPNATSNLDQPIDYQLVIDNPLNDTTITPGQSFVGISGYMEPGADFATQFELIYDGQVVQANDSPAFVIDQLERGTHTISIRVLDEYGVNIATSQRIQIHVQRPSVAK